eukprot:767281-Hanusia_phi.AAC.3
MVDSRAVPVVTVTRGILYFERSHLRFLDVFMHDHDLRSRSHWRSVQTREGKQQETFFDK